jgi:gliding motility-associated-like protein
MQLTPLDNAMQIQLMEEVPWDNIRYEYYRKGPLDADFVLVLDTTVSSWIDQDLLNNQPYCYKIRTKGTYGTTGVKDPLWNWSQEACAQPYDQEPPCPPALKAESNCEVPILQLHWNKPNCADDVTGYRLYRSEVEGEPFVLIHETSNNEDTTFTIQPEVSNGSIAGCYVVTALDSLNLWPNGQLNQNESVFSDTLCFDNCPYYALPNMFTPNGDQHNDTYDAFPYRSIDHVEMKIFNRWGTMVFETTDPSIIWSGKDIQTDKLCEDGVYYYTIQVFEIRLSGINPYSLNGWLHLIDSKVSTIIE